jgi:hypothetical protein
MLGHLVRVPLTAEEPDRFASAYEPTAGRPGVRSLLDTRHRDPVTGVP